LCANEFANTTKRKEKIIAVTVASVADIPAAAAAAAAAATTTTTS